VIKLVSELEGAIEREKALSQAPPQGAIVLETRPSPAPILTAAPSPAPVAVVAAPKVAKPKAKRLWVWGVVAAVAAGIAVGVGVGVGIGTQPHPPRADGAVSF